MTKGYSGARYETYNVSKEVRKMRFEAYYEGYTRRRLSQSAVVDVRGV